MHPAEIMAELKMRGLTVNAVADSLGFSKTAVGAVIRGTSRSRNVEQALSTFLRKPLHVIWPQYYEKEVVIEQKKESRLSVFDSSEVARIPMYGTRLSAGNGALADEEQKGWLAYRRSYLSYIGVDPNSAICVRIKGESMEPYLYDGDTVLIDTDDRTVSKPRADDTQRRTYAIAVNDELRCKIVETDPEEPGVVVISSRSPDFPIERLQNDAVRIIGRVRQSSRTWF